MNEKLLSVTRTGVKSYDETIYGWLTAGKKLAMLEEPMRVTDSLPSPTQKDYDNGYVMRFFLRPVNRKDEIHEVAETVYTKIQALKYYKKLSLKWRISGSETSIVDPISGAKLYYSVSESNNLAIDDAIAQLPGIEKILIDPLQFWRGY
jgi:hypothetical protein